jgi:hypothetical protein
MTAAGRPALRLLLLALTVATLLLAVSPAALAATSGLDGRAVVAIQQAELTASDAGPRTFLGCSVSLDGDTALVGALDRAAYVFTRTGEVWTEQQKLVADSPDTAVGFGQRVALSGDTALVSAFQRDVNTGAVYVFTRTAGVWTQQQVLTASDAAIFSYFGYSVAIDGDTALIGALAGSGAAYVFTRSGTTWTEQQRLSVGDGFGYAVALDGDTALVGAVTEENNRGAAYVFTRSGATFTQQARIVASDGVRYDSFGTSVALSGGTALVGAPFKDAYRGAAYVFARSGTTWSQLAELAADDGAANDEFGRAVALSGDVAVVGAPSRDMWRGAAYVFTRDGAAWAQKTAFTLGQAAEADFFGRSVALSGGDALIGAEGRNDGRGAAYVFVPPPTFPVTAVSFSGGGTVSPLGTTWVPLLENLTVTVTPEPHYHTARVTIDGAAVRVQPSYTFVKVSSRHRLEASFALDSYAVTPSVVPGADGRPHGTVSPATAKTYLWGSTPAFSFRPETGYAVFEVKVDGVRVLPTPRTSFTFAPLTGPHTISVRFVKNYVPTPQ